MDYLARAERLMAIAGGKRYSPAQYLAAVARGEISPADAVRFEGGDLADAHFIVQKGGAAMRRLALRARLRRAAREL